MERANETAKGGRAVRVLRNQAGQALMETSLVITVLILLMLGVLEFGRAFVVASMVNNAARVGARAVALAPPLDRDLSGYVINTSSIEDRVRQEISAVVDAATAADLDVVVRQTDTSPPLAQVTITGTIPYIFNLIGTEFAVNRTVSFRDEGRN